MASFINQIARNEARFTQSALSYLDLMARDYYSLDDGPERWREFAATWGGPYIEQQAPAVLGEVYRDLDIQIEHRAYSAAWALLREHLHHDTDNATKDMYDRLRASHIVRVAKLEAEEL